MNTTPPRRFRFGLRTLFVVVVIVSIPCAWVGYSLNWIRERHALLNEPLIWRTGVIGRPVPPPPPAPAWLWVFGERGIADLEVGEHQAERADRLFPEARIDVFDGTH